MAQRGVPSNPSTQLFLFLLEQHVPHGSSLISTTAQLGALENVPCLLLSLLLLLFRLRNGFSPLPSCCHLVEISPAKLLGHSVVGGAVIPGDFTRILGRYVVYIDWVRFFISP